jgi:deoxyribodipyrimidine photo-lyase
MMVSLPAWGLLVTQPVLLWFRRNLRLADNAALTAAADSGRPVIPVYVLDGQEPGGASRWWLQHSLVSLDRTLRDLGGSLIIRSGSPQRVLAEVCAQSGARTLYYSRRYEPASRRQEDDIHDALDGRIEIHAFDDSLLHRPGSIMTRSGKPYRVFSPFWKAAAGEREPGLPLPVPTSIHFAGQALESRPLADLELSCFPADQKHGFMETWTPGEPGGLLRIDELESKLRDYADHRDRPDIDATSRLSPYLHFGEVSVRQVWHAVRQLEMPLRSATGGEALLRQLYWRDFSAYLLYHFPSLPDKPLRGEFEDFPWSGDDSLLQAWQQGMTGYPIVDAGMRQLRHTGWMHNRVRMIVASFLVKDLMIPWQTGAAWFLDALVDADLANNSASWQWVAGCGSDAAPYFRIFNPTLQGKKFDPHGDYVREWVPELGGPEYPAPIVDHGLARQRALEAYRSVKGMRTSKLAP